MPLEATMMVLDNSEYMRNGDYPPSRLNAQSDAVHVVFGSKTDSNPENTVGIMSMAGKSPEVLVTPTQDIGKILTALHNLKIEGESDITTGIQIAQLALKHRQNKNQRQRIIVFVGSPLISDERALVKLGKKLKKNNVAVDVISFGEDEENDAKLRVFVDTVSSADNSHLLSIPAGPHLISDMIISSPILAGEDGVPSGSGAGGAGGGDFEFGVDPSMDPELAEALRLSMQEAQARQDATEPAPTSSTPAAAAPVVASANVSVAETPAPTTTAGEAIVEDDNEDEELARALALSQQAMDVDMANEEDIDEQEAIARAIAESERENEGK